MNDLNNIGNGKKLIKEVIKNSKSIRTKWNKAQQVKQLKFQKNSHNTQSRLFKK